MEAIEISAERRKTSGKGSNRRLRAQGQIPAVMYGKGMSDAISVSLDPRELAKALANPKKANALFKVNLGDEEAPLVLVREIQRDPVSRAILHVDLVSPDLDASRVAVIPIRLTGKSKGVSVGGRLRTPYRDIRVLSRPSDIPAEVVVDITELAIGDAVMASNLALPEGVKPIYDTDYIVVKVLKPRGGTAASDDVGEADNAAAEAS